MSNEGSQEDIVSKMQGSWVHNEENPMYTFMNLNLKQNERNIKETKKKIEMLQ
eukprot:CAMPEP_0170562522 /NCGR_PEP_ID=MMETSP0211-20121228/60983_1 /TAXON_ID=311385 /ORGANISM="Pseudokeronopsis sp., Strain OXSARD2" /LENGTH=52 /DNA_ID=CAMNT_0010879509 /DNA_START=846 /DNA_END=1004 /DNA_ORIENTATION=-